MSNYHHFHRSDDLNKYYFQDKRDSYHLKNISNNNMNKYECCPKSYDYENNERNERPKQYFHNQYVSNIHHHTNYNSYNHNNNLIYHHGVYEGNYRIKNHEHDYKKEDPFHHEENHTYYKHHFPRNEEKRYSFHFNKYRLHKYRSDKSYSKNYHHHKSRSRSRNSSSSKSFYKKSDSGSYSVETNLSHKLYPYAINEIIESPNDKQYKVIKHLDDGTFGRVLLVEDSKTNLQYAMKIILPIDKYIESAKIETEMIKLVNNKDPEDRSKCIRIKDSFIFYRHNIKYYAIIFELLGKSLYECIKSNNFQGFSIFQIQNIAKQIFEGIEFIHNIGIIHTDLKPENILFINSDYKKITEPKELPINCHFVTDEKNKEVFYKSIINTNIKIIDFGSAVESKDRGIGIINTRQYRSPEVILECCLWDEKSDIWSLGCILLELYTGNLLFNTHNNQEHLCLISKVCGHYPNWMIDNCKNKDLKLIFKRCERHGFKDHKPCYYLCENKENVNIALSKTKTLSEQINEKHKVFYEFLKDLLIIDPNKRPSAHEALSHKFFSEKFE